MKTRPKPPRKRQKPPRSRQEPTRRAVGAAAVFSAAALQILGGCESIRLHWVVDLRDRPVGRVSDPTDPDSRRADPEWWNTVERFRGALASQGAVPAAIDCECMLTLAHYTYPTNLPVRSTFKLGWRVQIEWFMALPPPLGKWVLWSKYVADPHAQAPNVWWWDDIPF